MKSQSLLLLACLVSSPVLAQSLPDEINYPPHQARYANISTQVREAEALLNSQRSSREEALKFISDMTSHIASLKTHIRELELQIAANRREIPELEGKVAGLKREWNRAQGELSGLKAQAVQLQNRHAQELRQLKSMEDNLSRKEQRIGELEGELSRAQEQERVASTRLLSLRNQLANLQREIQEERIEQRDLLVNIRSLEVRIPQQQSIISQLESQVNSLNSSLHLVRQKLSSLNTRVSAAQSELNRARTEANSSADIVEAERRLAHATNQRQLATLALGRLEAEVARKEQELQRQKVQLEGLHRDKQTMGTRIAQQESAIRTAEGKIASLNPTLSLERKKVETLNGRVEQYKTELANLRAQNAPADQIKDAERKLNAVTRTRDNTVTEVRNLEGQISGLNIEIAHARNQITSLRQQQQTIDARISQQQNVVSQHESQVKTGKAQLVRERQQLEGLGLRVQEAQTALNAARSRAQEKIQDFERRLAAITNTRDNTANEVRKLEAQVSPLSQKLQLENTQLNELLRSKETMARQMAQSETRERNLTNERQVLSSESTRAEAELVQAQRNIEARRGPLANLRQEYVQDERLVQRQVDLLHGLDREIESQKSLITSKTSEMNSLNRQIAQHSERAQLLKTQIPQLEDKIHDNESEISQGNRDIESARRDEERLVKEIAQQEKVLSGLVSEQSKAEVEMNNRLSLYKRYYAEAERLGSSQTQEAKVLGEAEGKRLTELLSKHNGVAMGEELGLAEAKLWGHVRGEVQGHEAGHQEGLISAPDIERGEAEGKAEGIRVAHVNAQANLRPGFFEEHLLEEFKRPLTPMAPAFKSLVSLKSLQRQELMSDVHLETIPPLTEQELAESEALSTALDLEIARMRREVKSLKFKAKELAHADSAFQSPEKIPYGKPNCSNVYKGLQVFKNACYSEYNWFFAYYYRGSAREVFLAEYRENYQAQLETSQVAQRELSFKGELAKAHEVGHAQGLKLGKNEIHQKSYERAYKVAHENEVPLAREKAWQDAKAELLEFIKVKPLLTLAGTALKGEVRANEELELTVKLKNIANVPFKGAALIRITHLQNAEMEMRQMVVNSAGARTISNAPAMKLKVLPTASVGQKLVVKGVVYLPGDAYKSQRQEKFELIETLSINPAHDLAVEYDSRPNIKGLFRRYVHTLSAKLKPQFEEIGEGYKVTLTPVGANAGLINLNETSLDTGALRAREEKDLNFTYTFQNAAKAKEIELELSVIFNNKVLSKEKILMVPR